MKSRLFVCSLPAWGSLLLSLSTLSFCQQAPAAPADPALEQEMNLAQQSLAAHRYDQAIKAYEKANKLQGKNCALCYLGMASAYLAENDVRRAAEDCDRALSLATDDRLRAVGHSLKGDVFVQMAASEPRKLAQAENEFRTAAQQDASTPAYHLKLGIVLLRELRDPEGLQEVEAYLKLAPQGSFASLARRLVADPDRARKSFAPDFRVTTLQGETYSLDDLAGKVVVLDFWATWCHPCVESVPDLKELTRKYASRGFVLISVSADEKESQWKQFVAKQQMDWPQYWDSDRRIADAFGVHAFPTYVVINEKGAIVQRIVGEDPQKSVAYRLRDALSALPQLQAGKKP